MPRVKGLRQTTLIAFLSLLSNQLLDTCCFYVESVLIGPCISHVIHPLENKQQYHLNYFILLNKTLLQMMW